MSLTELSPPTPAFLTFSQIKKFPHKEFIRETIAKSGILRYYKNIDVIEVLELQPSMKKNGGKHSKMVGGVDGFFSKCFAFFCRNKVYPKPAEYSVSCVTTNLTNIKDIPFKGPYDEMCIEVHIDEKLRNNSTNETKALIILNRLKMHLFLKILTVKEDNVNDAYISVNDLIQHIESQKIPVTYKDGVYKCEYNGDTYNFNINFFTNGEDISFTRIYPVPGSPTSTEERCFPNEFVLPGQVPASAEAEATSGTKPPFYFQNLPLDIQGVILQNFPKKHLPVALQKTQDARSLSPPKEITESSLRKIIRQAVSQENGANTYIFTNTVNTHAFLDVNVVKKDENSERHVSGYMQDDNGDTTDVFSFVYSNNHDSAAEAAEGTLNTLFKDNKTNPIFKVQVEGQEYKTYYLKEYIAKVTDFDTELSKHVVEYNRLNIKVSDQQPPGSIPVESFIKDLEKNKISKFTFSVDSAYRGEPTKYGYFSVIDYIAYKMLMNNSTPGDVVQIQYNLEDRNYTISKIEQSQLGGSPSFTFMGKKLRVLSKGKQSYVLITFKQARAFEKKLGIKTKDATHVFGRSRKTVEHRGHTYALVPLKTLQTMKKSTPIQR
jgi:hypothetical protein